MPVGIAFLARRANWPLLLVGAAWIAIALFTVVLYLSYIPVQLETLRRVCITGGCSQGQLAPGGIRALQDIGLTIDHYAALMAGLDIAASALLIIFSAVLFWRKPVERMALFYSLILLIFASGIHPEYLEAFQPVLQFFANILSSLAVAAVLVFVYLFPDGRFVPSWTRYLACTWLAVWSAAIVLPGTPLDPNMWPETLGLLVPLGFVASGVIIPVYRYVRVSGAVERQQTKWAILGIAAALITTVVVEGFSMIFPGLRQDGSLQASVFDWISFLPVLMITLSIGVAVLRYRLWDIDIIINRTLVYATLTAMVVSVYVLAVSGLEALLPVRGEPILSLLVTGFVAVLFAPLRERVQHGVNHLMYGDRDDPYAVMSRLGQRLESTLSPDTMLPIVTETVASALKVPYVEISTWEDGALKAITSSGAPTSRLIRHSLIFQGEVVGEIAVATRRGSGHFSPADHRLLEDLARQIGVVVQAVRLNSALQRSRERLVTTREEERRRLRRDLHDGLGPTLASLFQRLDAAGALVPLDPEAAVMIIDNLKGQVKSTIADIRQLVYALRPPALDELGLIPAIDQHIARYSSDSLCVSIEAPERLPPLPAAVEVAAYRLVIEAVTNTVRHASARICTIRLTIDDDLRIDITDDGKGLPPVYRAGVGMASMRERVEELGGTFGFESKPNAGTRIWARLSITRE
ncbi:hypothetical protein BH23CHL1_BH23CHL1_15110 [soil metagenome]